MFSDIFQNFCRFFPFKKRNIHHFLLCKTDLKKQTIGHKKISPFLFFSDSVNLACLKNIRRRYRKLLYHNKPFSTMHVPVVICSISTHSFCSIKEKPPLMKWLFLNASHRSPIDCGDQCDKKMLRSQIYKT